MKKFRKATTFLILCSLLCTAACGSEAARTDDIPDAVSSDDTAAETTVTGSAYTAPDVDYGGETFTVLDYVTEEYSYQAYSYSNIHCEEENGDPINDALWKRNRAVEEELNIQFEIYPVGGGTSADRKAMGDELRKLVLASDDTVDLSYAFGTSLSTLLAEQGLLLNINDIPGLDYEASWWDQTAIEAYSINGNFKAILGDACLYRSYAPTIFFYNKNVADMYDLENFYDMVRDNTWTFDVMYDACRTVATDINGDNTMDENDRYGTALQTHLGSEMLMSYGGRFTDFNESGELTLVLNSERNEKIMTDVVAFINDININCQAQQFTDKYSNVFSDLHIPMFKNDQLLFNYQSLLIANDLRSMEADYGLLPSPKYDAEQKDYCTFMSNSFMAYLVVPSTNAKLEMTGHIMNALGYYSEQYVTPAFIDTTVRAKSLRDEDSAEMLDIILNTAVYDLMIIYDWGGMQSNIKKLAILSQGFSSVYASYESAALTAMAKTEAMLKSE